MSECQSEDFHRVERNLFEYAFGSGINKIGLVREDTRVKYFCSSLAIPALNLAYLKTNQPEKKDLDNIEFFFREYGIPYTIWLPSDEMVCPTLIERGLDHCTNLHAMIADLEDEKRVLRAPAGYRLRFVNQESDMEAFASAAFNGYEMPNDIWEKFSDLIRNLGTSQYPQNELVVAFKEEEPVGSGLMFRGKDDIGLYWDFRGATAS
jgi:hypothetical protein